MADTVVSVEEHIQSLPQELQDAILDFTIAVDTTTTININDDYRPPTKQLSINRKTSATLAQQYYSTNTFSYALISNIPAKIRPTTWLSNVAPEHRDKIRMLRIFVDWVDQNQRCGAPLRYNFDTQCLRLRTLIEGAYGKLRESGIQLAPGVIRGNCMLLYMDVTFFSCNPEHSLHVFLLGKPQYKQLDQVSSHHMLA